MLRFDRIFEFQYQFQQLYLLGHLYYQVDEHRLKVIKLKC